MRYGAHQCAYWMSLVAPFLPILLPLSSSVSMNACAATGAELVTDDVLGFSVVDAAGW